MGLRLCWDQRRPGCRSGEAAQLPYSRAAHAAPGHSSAVPEAQAGLSPMEPLTMSSRSEGVSHPDPQREEPPSFSGLRPARGLSPARTGGSAACEHEDLMSTNNVEDGPVPAPGATLSLRKHSQACGPCPGPPRCGPPTLPKTVFGRTPTRPQEEAFSPETVSVHHVLPVPAPTLRRKGPEELPPPPPPSKNSSQKALSARPGNQS